MPSSSPSIASGSASAPTLASASARAASFVLDVRSTLWRLNSGPTYRPRFDYVSTPDFSTAPTEDGDVMIGGTGFSIAGTATVYLGAFMDETEADVQVALPACSLADLNVRRSAGTGTTVYTLRKNGSDTAMTVTLSGATTTGSVAGPVSFAAGDLFSLKIVATGGATAYHSYGVTATPA